MFEPALTFVSTSSQTNFRTLVWVLTYGHVVYVPSSSLVLVSRYKRVATVRNFYTEDAYATISGEFYLIQTKTSTHDNKKHMVDHNHLDKIYSSFFFLKIVMEPLFLLLFIVIVYIFK
jgi:hypothetical protein